METTDGVRDTWHLYRIVPPGRQEGWPGGTIPYFNPIFLGEKNEALDYLVELTGIEIGTPFFFVQVKSTKLGYTSDVGNRRLRVKVPKESIEKIQRYPAPTYLVGVDDRKSRSFIMAILAGTPRGFSSMTTRYPLNCVNLRRLWCEVRDYWRGREMRMRSSFFSS
jgi:hypothetical protein